MFRVAVCVSGRGSNLDALLRVLRGDPERGNQTRVVMVIGNRADAGGLAVARAHDVPVHLLEDADDAAEWLRVLREAKADLVVLAGFLRKVPRGVVEAYRGRIINIHPALLPRHGGPGMYGARVHQAVLAAGDPVSGATVHLVDEEYDRGPVLGRSEVPVLPGDTPETLAARVLEAEHRLLPAAVLAAARAGHPVEFELETPRSLIPGP